MRKLVGRLVDESAGFVKDMSEIIAIEALKEPGLIPDLSSSRTLFVFSDYGGGHKGSRYETYSFLVITRETADFFNDARLILRSDFNLANRRMSFKGLNDQVKLRALPAFLSLAGRLEGVVLTVAVDKTVKNIFSGQVLSAFPELASVNKSTVEKLFRVLHFGCLAILAVFSPNQNVVWFTDDDEIVSNDQAEQWFGVLASAVIKRFVHEEPVGRLGFGKTTVDDGTLGVEDLTAVPDLVAGALSETLSALALQKLRVVSRIALKAPPVSSKTNAICQWLAYPYHSLEKLAIVLDRSGPKEFDFVPTYFAIRPANGPSESFRRSGYREKSGRTNQPMHPIRFDIADFEPLPQAEKSPPPASPPDEASSTQSRKGEEESGR